MARSEENDTAEEEVEEEEAEEEVVWQSGRRQSKVSSASLKAVLSSSWVSWEPNWYTRRYKHSEGCTPHRYEQYSMCSKWTNYRAKVL